MGRMIMTEVELNELCKEYQKMLRIQDWDIKVELVEQRDIAGYEGLNEINYSFKKVYMKLPKPETFSSSFVNTKQDMHATLLHELVHVVFALCDPKYEKGDIKYNLWEHGIETVAQAFKKLLEERDGVVVEADPDADGTVTEVKKGRLI